MTHLSTTSPEWPAMWDALARATGDYADCCPETGECWQYMGTYDGAHQFRHRHRPQIIQGRPIKPIEGFAGQHWDRVYLHLDAETLEVARVHVVPYLDDKPSDYTHAGGRPTREDLSGPDHQRMNCPRCCGNHPLRDCPHPDQEQFEANYGGSFDGFSVTSDADPGL